MLMIVLLSLESSESSQSITTDSLIISIGQNGGDREVETVP